MELARKGSIRGVGSQALMLFGVKVLVRVLGPFVTILVIRILGAEKYGDLASVLALAGVIGSIAEFGIGPTVLKLLSQDKYSRPSVIVSAFRFAGISACIATVLTVIWMLSFDYSALQFQLGLLTSLNYFVIALSASCNAYFQHKAEYGTIAKTELLTSSATSLSTLVLVLLHVDIRLLWLIPWVLGSSVTFLSYSKKIVPKLRAAVRERISSWILLREAGLFAAGNMLYQIYYQSDIVVLSILAGAIYVGHYAAAYKFVALVYIVPGILFNEILYARYFQWRHKRPDLYVSTYVLVNKLMLIVGSGAGITLVVAAPLLIALTLGGEYTASVSLLRTLALTIPIRMLASSVGAILIANDLVRSRLGVQVTAAVANLCLNLYLVPRVGPVGAAWSTVFAELIVLIGYGVLVHRRVFPLRLVRELRLPVFLILALVQIGIGQLELPPSASAAVFGSVVLAVSIYLLWTKYVRPSEVRRWWNEVNS